MLAAGRRAALDFARRTAASRALRLHVEPELDIVTYLPAAGSLSEVDAARAPRRRAGIAGDDPVYLSLLHVARGRSSPRHPELEPDADGARILRRSDEARARGRCGLAAGPGRSLAREALAG